jgi:hypothetical protein
MKQSGDRVAVVSHLSQVPQLVAVVSHLSQVPQLVAVEAGRPHGSTAQEAESDQDAPLLTQIGHHHGTDRTKTRGATRG